MGICFVNCFMEIQLTYLNIHPFKPLSDILLYSELYYHRLNLLSECVYPKRNPVPISSHTSFPPSPPALLSLFSVSVD